MRKSFRLACLACGLVLIICAGSALSQRLPTILPPKPQADVAPVPRPDSLRPAEWRHTRNGWETMDQLTAHRPQRNPAPATRLHPLVVGSLVFLLSLAVLLFFDEEQSSS